MEVWKILCMSMCAWVCESKMGGGRKTGFYAPEYAILTWKCYLVRMEVQNFLFNFKLKFQNVMLIISTTYSHFPKSGLTVEN